jgi:RNA polymerase sigma-70 factor (ECF subfamily)
VRRARGDADWPAIVALYEALHALTNSPVVLLNRAAAVEHAAGAESALAEMEAIEERLSHYQPFWALKAHLLGRLGRNGEARAAYAEAIARECDATVIRFLEEKAGRL